MLVPWSLSRDYISQAAEWHETPSPQPALTPINPLPGLKKDLSSVFYFVSFLSSPPPSVSLRVFFIFALLCFPHSSEASPSRSRLFSSPSHSVANSVSLSATVLHAILFLSLPLPPPSFHLQLSLPLCHCHPVCA